MQNKVGLFDWIEMNRDKLFFLFFHTNYMNKDGWGEKPHNRNDVGKPYDEQVKKLDDMLGELFSVLRKLNVYDESLIIVTGDQGKCFGNDGDSRNAVLGRRLAQEAMRSLLMIKLPKSISSGPASRVSVPVSLEDIFPTVVDGLNIPIRISFDGVSLIPLMKLNETKSENVPDTFRERIFIAGAQSPQTDESTKVSAIRQGKYKLILKGDVIHGDLNVEPFELYDLHTDPGETRDLLKEKNSDYNHMAQDMIKNYRTITNSRMKKYAPKN